MKLKNREAIEQWLNSMGVKNYTINEGLIVDVKGSVILVNKNLTEIPIQFGKINGEFDCSYNKLTTLRGCPSYVQNFFYCTDNLLTTLEGAPLEVEGFLANNNLLISTKGISKHIKKYCNLTQNPITHIDELPHTLAETLIFDNTEGIVEDFKDLYVETDPKEPAYLDISLAQINAFYLQKKLDNTLKSSNIVNTFRGKI